MTIDELIAAVRRKAPPAPEASIEHLEEELGHPLPDDYRYFLINCNGGGVGGSLWFRGLDDKGRTTEAGVHHVGGFREEYSFSLQQHAYTYKGRIPQSLLWIHGDPFGNAVCLGVAPPYRGRVYFWDHENEPGDGWDGSVETAGNLTLLAHSFTEYVAGLRPLEEFG
jgi:hypothetical protein